MYQIVLDTNVLVTALRSRRGASFKLLSLTGDARFQLNISVPLILEYEAAAKRLTQTGALTDADIDAIIDYLCQAGNRRQIFFLWRPCLKDPQDDLLLELAVEAKCDFIVTYNKRDFVEAARFGVKLLTPKEFLQLLGEIP
jgi:putative PIN family toxin of toxin-antitoxin system